MKKLLLCGLIGIMLTAQSEAQMPNMGGKRFNREEMMKQRQQNAPTPQTASAPAGTIEGRISSLEQKMDKLIAVVENALIPAVKQDKIFALDGKQFAVATAVSRS